MRKSCSKFLQTREQNFGPGSNSFIAEGVIDRNGKIRHIDYFRESKEEKGKPDTNAWVATQKYEPPLTYNPIDSSITASPNTKVTYEEQF